jgi:hypothetical protein
MTSWKEALERAVVQLLGARHGTEWKVYEVLDVYRPGVKRQAANMLAAALKSLEQSGYVVVPREPTDPMRLAGYEADADYNKDFEIYTAMIQAWEKERDQK